MIEYQNFLKSYDELKAYSLSANFSDIVNPVDLVVYPGICDSIPDNIKSELFDRIREFLGREPVNPTLFMRRSPLGVHVPQIAHTDLSMGDYSLMLYLNDHGHGGTALIRHVETAMNSHPVNDEELEITIRDQNNPEKWAINRIFKMKQNNCCIFPADLFHCALPIGGFGHGSEARTVLTCFFN